MSAELDAALASADSALASASRNFLDANGALDYGAGVVSARRAASDVLSVVSALYSVIPYAPNPGQLDDSIKTIRRENAKVDAIALACVMYPGGPMDANCFLQKAVRTASAPIGNMVVALRQAIAAARPAPSPTSLHPRVPTSAPLPAWSAPTRHRVSAGETPMKIAQKYGGHMSELVAANTHKPLANVAGVTTFASLAHGESLNLPSHWTAG